MRNQKTDIWMYFIRHGQSKSNLHPELIGGSDKNPNLTNLGREQARALGEMFKKDGLRFDRIFSSILDRAVETAEIAATAMGFQKEMACFAEQELSYVEEVEDLVEIGRGDWQGVPRVDVMSPELRLLQAQKGKEFATPGGESPDDVADRVKRWVKKRLINDPSVSDGSEGVRRVAIFMHGIAIKAFFGNILRMDSAIEWQTPIGNCSVSILRYTARGWKLVCYNDMSVRFFVDKKFGWKWEWKSAEE
jgi:broad specificity phosphatase PhoE